jgi:RNA polymerase sigma factor (sigma-70 family)
VGDGEIVAGIVAGEPAALVAAYDRYAEPLYAYCQSRLHDPVVAADAVKATFIIAAAKLGRLRDRSRLGPWLYAVARNECRRQLPGRDVVRVPEDSMVGEETVNFGTALQQAEDRELVLSALAGLSAADQEIVELSLRHGLHGRDLADVLGVPAGRTGALESGARQRFETALGALLMARSGEGSCPQLSEILRGWDQELTESVGDQVRQHIGSCPICQPAQRHQVDPVSMLQVLPVSHLPAGLRYEIVQLLTDQSADASEYCVAVASRAEAFNRAGFPVAIDPPVARSSQARLLPVAAGLAVGVLLLGGGVALAAHEMHHSAGPATPVQTSAIPSTHPAPTVTKARSGHAKHRPKARAVNSAAVVVPGFSSVPAATHRASSHVTTPPAHPTSAKPTKSKHSTPPSSPPPPPTTPPATTPPPTTPPASPPTAGAVTHGGSTTGVLGSIIHLLSAL